jgi:hypothetical protein
MKYFKILFVCFVLTFSLQAREIECNVVVNHMKIQDMDQQVFRNMERSIIEFVNTRIWTSDNYELFERINCSFLINLESRSNNDFSASLQVQSIRPVYGTNYTTTMFVVNDLDFDFTYVDQQPMDFNLQSFESNLTSVIAFYIYFIIGMDYDTFAPEGGTKYYQNAFEIVNNAQSSGGKGWAAAGGDKNRYWLIENVMNSIFQPFRKMLYDYHRLGLDVMRTDKLGGEKVVFNSMKSLVEVNRVRPSSFLLQVYFNAKSDEIVKMFSKSTKEIKDDITKTMILIDPGNTKKYNKISQ